MALRNWIPSVLHPPSKFCAPTTLSIVVSLPSSSFILRNRTNDYTREAEASSLCWSKRRLNLSIFAFLFNGVLHNNGDAIPIQDMELERYTDPIEGFTLLRPSSWIKVDKAGAAALFEQPDKGSNNVGVVVNPVRIKSLVEFGSPQFVADKLLQAEIRKESTKGVEVISTEETSGQGGMQIYEFEYKVDTTRGGMKRIFAAAFVNSKKLYLLNIAYSDKPENPLDSDTRKILEQVLHSFDAAPVA